MLKLFGLQHSCCNCIDCNVFTLQLKVCENCAIFITLASISRNQEVNSLTEARSKQSFLSILLRLGGLW